ncbi:MAG: glucose-1-phosphate cytidylyltransferase [Hyphomicrobium sp.]
MKAVILAGGLGTRLAEETDVKPKPMVEIGDRPILWHIMKIFSAHGVNDFIVCLGYKGYLIKEFFVNYGLHLSDITVDTASHSIEIHSRRAEAWRISLIETGADTMTGGRIRRIRDYLGNENFFMTYGDGVADVDIGKLKAFHESHGLLATVTAVTPPGRFGALEISGDRVTRFREKPSGDGGKINGGFFVLSPGIFDYIDSDSTVWEREPMERLAQANQLAAYDHTGFWQPMDTLRDKNHLENLWATNRAPWKTW